MSAAGPHEPVGPPPLPAGGPLSIGQVVEVAMAVLVARRGTALLLAVLFVAPGAILTAALGLRFNDVVAEVIPDLDAAIGGGAVLFTAAEAERLVAAAVAYVSSSVVAGLLASIGAVAFSRLLAVELRVGPADLADALGVALRRTLSVVGFALVSSAIVIGLIGIGLGGSFMALTLLSQGPLTRGGPGVFVALVIGVAIVVALTYLTLRWAPAWAVMAIEETGWQRTMARSWELSAERVWRILAVVVLGTVVSFLISALVAQLLALVVVDWAGAALGLDPIVGESLAVAAGAVVAAPIAPLLIAVLYVDLRRRRDGEEMAPAQQPGTAE